MLSVFSTKVLKKRNNTNNTKELNMDNNISSITDQADPNPNPKPSLRTNSTNKRAPFGSSGKSLSFEEKICTVIPNDSLFMQTDSDHDDEGRSKCFRTFNKSGKWWEPDSDRNWTQYCSNTSIHGLKYIGEPKRHIYERFFWLFAFGISCLAATYLINAVWLKYTESPVVITFQGSETFVKQVPFPAVTVCNMNKVLKSKAKEYMRAAMSPDETDSKTVEAWKNVYYLNHVCSSSNKPFSTTFNYTSTQGTVSPHILELVSSKIKPTDTDVEDVANFLQRASQPCNDMLKLCLWQGEEFPCNQLFRPIETNFGKCCTFNMLPQTLLHRYKDDERDTPQDIKDWRKADMKRFGLLEADEITTKTKNKYPRRQTRAGKVSGLSFLLDPDLDEYFCTSSDSTGFRLVTHLSTDSPHVTDFGLAIRPNSEHFVSVRPEITLADDTIDQSIDTKKRKCYMEDEFKLSYYDYYTSWNCLDECIANITFKKCGCVRYYMPRDHKRAICGPEKKLYDCAENVKKESFSSGVQDSCEKCLPTCTEIKYFADASATPFRRRIDLWVDDFNKSTSWAKSNISIVHVYFGQESSYARVRSRLYGLTDLIANFGGLTGLCMGFSGLSLVELIYFFTIRVWYRSKRKIHNHKKKQFREAVERDRDKMLAYLGVGSVPSSRRSSIDSSKPISIITNTTNNSKMMDGDSGYNSNSPNRKKNEKNDDNVGNVAISKF